jgi:hypothetical protein
MLACVLSAIVQTIPDSRSKVALLQRQDRISEARDWQATGLDTSPGGYIPPAFD